nr:hypothetical protein [Tanacetum cinerariifolium]
MDNSYEIFKAKISVRSKLQYLQKMKCKLQPFPNRYMMFSDSVFGPWLDLHEFSNHNHLLNYVLQHQRAYMWRCFYKRTLNVVKNHAEKKDLKKMTIYNLNGFVWAPEDSIPNLVLLPTSGELKSYWLVRSQYYFNGEDAPFIQSVKQKCSDFQRCDSKVVDYVKTGQEDFPRLENVPVDVVQKQDCTLVEQAKNLTCSTSVQVDVVINQDVSLVQETHDVLGNVGSFYKGLLEQKIIDTVELLCKQLIDVRPEMKGMVDQLNSKVIDTLTTTFESARKHAEVVEAKVVNYGTNLVECLVVEKDVRVLRVAVVSCAMDLVDCPVVQEDIFYPKNLMYKDTQPSTMEHLVNACDFVSPLLPFHDSLKADKFVKLAQVTNDIDDYMNIENDPSKYCLDNLTIGIEEDTQNGELTASEVNVVKDDGKSILGKVFEVIGRIKKPRIFKQAPYTQKRPTTPQVKKKRKSPDVYEMLFKEWCWTKENVQVSLAHDVWIDLLWRFRAPNVDWSIVGPRFCSSILSGQLPFFYASNKRYAVLWSDVKKVYFSLNQPQIHWALTHLQIRTGVITVYDSMASRKRNKKLPIQ